MLEGYSIANLQNFKTLAKHLMKAGLDQEDWIEIVDKEIKERLELRGLLREQAQKDFYALNQEFNKKTKKCPVCGWGLSLMSVNTNRRNQVGENFKSLWYCQKCNEHEEYSKLSVEDHLKALDIKPMGHHRRPRKVKTGHKAKQYYQRRR